jgi:signal transduction histidine kinase
MSTDIIDLTLRKLDLPSYETIRKHIDIINTEVTRFKGIMDDILTFGKTENNMISVSRSTVSILALIEKSIGRIREVNEEDRMIEIKTKGDIREVFVDASQMEHILENLISNAYKFSKGRPAPELSVTFHKDSFVLHVQDFGIGIPESDQPRLFSSFYRASNTTNIRGTGLGLVIIKNLVRLQKGTIEILSKENKGTLVVVAING